MRSINAFPAGTIYSGYHLVLTISPFKKIKPGKRENQKKQGLLSLKGLMENLRKRKIKLFLFKSHPT